MNTYYLMVILFLPNLTLVIGQTETDINIPEFNDDYCETISTLESGKTNIDYKKFRESFLESKQFKIALSKSSEIKELEKEMYV